jgi:hypothetical protein
MENELRNAARNGLILRKEEASTHLAEARRHLEQAMNEAKGIEPPNGPQTPLRKEGDSAFGSATGAATAASFCLSHTETAGDQSRHWQGKFLTRIELPDRDLQTVAKSIC